MELNEIFSGGSTSIIISIVGIFFLLALAKKLIKLAIFAAIAFAAYSYFSENGTPSFSNASSGISSATKSATKTLK